MSELVLDDADALADLGTYAARARHLDGDGAIRLMARGRTLAAYVCVVPGAGLGGDGTVLGLRVFGLAEPADVDVTVALAAVTDRTSRRTGSPVLPVPPALVTTAWAGVSPPRTGWAPLAVVTSEVVDDIARAGIDEVAQGTPASAGAPVVTALRQRVWGATVSIDTGVPMPRGLAFAAQALGFATGEPLTLHGAGRWTRLSGRGGHALAR